MIQDQMKQFEKEWILIEKQSEIVGTGLSVKEALQMKQRTVIIEGLKDNITREDIISQFK